MNRGFRLVLVLAIAAGTWQPVCAATGASAKYVLYSWKDGNDWDFSLLPASKEHQVLAEIKHMGGPLHGAGKIKEKLLAMKEGDQITWQTRTESGLVYPPKPVMEDVVGYARTVGVKVSVPSR